MAGQSIALATKGIICKGIGEITRITRCVLPLNLQLKTDLFKLSLKKQDPMKLNLSISEPKITLKNSSKTQLTLKRIDNFKLSLKKCEDS